MTTLIVKLCDAALWWKYKNMQTREWFECDCDALGNVLRCLPFKFLIQIYLKAIKVISLAILEIKMWILTTETFLRASIEEKLSGFNRCRQLIRRELFMKMDRKTECFIWMLKLEKGNLTCSSQGRNLFIDHAIELLSSKMSRRLHTCISQRALQIQCKHICAITLIVFTRHNI